MSVTNRRTDGHYRSKCRA